MKAFIFHIVFIVVGYLPFSDIASQSLYSIQSINLNTRDYDEDCAVPYKDGIVFLSNQTQSTFSVRVDTAGKPLLDIFFARQRENKKFASPDIFSKDLKSKVQESAISFDKKGDVIWFTRVEDDSRSALFSAAQSSLGWGNITAFPHNMGGYNFGHPNISADGKSYFLHQIVRVGWEVAIYGYVPLTERVGGRLKILEEKSIRKPMNIIPFIIWMENFILHQTGQGDMEALIFTGVRKLMENGLLHNAWMHR